MGSRCAHTELAPSKSCPTPSHEQTIGPSVTKCPPFDSDLWSKSVQTSWMLGEEIGVRTGFTRRQSGFQHLDFTGKPTVQRRGCLKLLQQGVGPTVSHGFSCSHDFQTEQFRCVIGEVKVLLCAKSSFFVRYSVLIAIGLDNFLQRGRCSSQGSGGTSPHVQLYGAARGCAAECSAQVPGAGDGPRLLDQWAKVDEPIRARVKLRGKLLYRYWVGS